MLPTDDDASPGPPAPRRPDDLDDPDTPVRADPTVAPVDAEAMWRLYATLRSQGRDAEAADCLESVASLGPGHPEALPAQEKLLQLLRKRAAAGDLLSHARTAVERFARSSFAWLALGECLLRLSRRAEAADALATAVALDPGNTDARALLRVAAEEPRPPRRKTVGWPKRLHLHGDVRSALRTTVLRGYPGGPGFISRETTFLTVGSCFALNLARSLNAAGYEAHSELFGEEINNTYANRYLLEWLETGAGSEQSAAMEAAYGPEARAGLLGKLSACDVFVFTLGLAPTFFERESGRFFFMNLKSDLSRAFAMRHCDMRTTTVAENVANIEAIVAAVRRLAKPSVKIVMTVSPVPLGATSEMDSAVIADCVSKSTLRVACHEALARPSLAGVEYWPSFEMVRWMAPYISENGVPPFESDARHVSPWLVDHVVGLFLETFSRDGTPALSSGDASASTAPGRVPLEGAARDGGALIP